MNVGSVFAPEIISGNNLKRSNKQEENSLSFQSFLPSDTDSEEALHFVHEEQMTDHSKKNDSDMIQPVIHSNQLDEADSNTVITNNVETFHDSSYKEESADDKQDQMLDSVVTELIALLQNHEQDVTGISLGEQQVNQLQKIVQENADWKNDETIIQQISNMIENDSAITDQQNEVEFIEKIGDLTLENMLHNEMIQLIGEINRILNEKEGRIPLKEKAGQLLPLLQQWSTIKKENSEATEKVINNELNEKDAHVWKHLINTYGKRTFFSEQNVYQSDASVTRSDVMSWLQQAFSHYVEQEEKVTGTTPITTDSQIPMTKVEQYTIHVQSIDKVERVSEEIVNKFTNIIRESRFLTNKNELNQLSIVLKPENLGNMTVRFMQVDGEMSVKIIVTSQVAKEMLESNMHQLKHMFSPHQIMIERDESISDEEFYLQDEDQDKQEEDSLSEERDSHENKDEDALEIDFQDILQQLSRKEEQ